MDSTTLDVGCGSRKHDGAFGLDIRPDSDADLVHDLRDTPWPLPADRFRRVYCHDIIEHVPDVSAFVRELHRVSAPGAEIEIRTPHFTSRYAYNDPTHLHAFGFFFLDHFTAEGATLSSGGGGALPLPGAPLPVRAGAPRAGHERPRQPFPRALRAVVLLDVPVREPAHPDHAGEVAAAGSSGDRRDMINRSGEGVGASGGGARAS